LTPRLACVADFLTSQKKKTKSEAEWDAEWKEKYGEEAAKVIRETVDKNMEDYLYMKQFCDQALGLIHIRSGCHYSAWTTWTLIDSSDRKRQLANDTVV